MMRQRAPDMRVTRGYGRLERFLASQRVRIADRNIDPQQRLGRILDVGCGTYPFFLMNIDFREKHGLDKLVDGMLPRGGDGIILRNFDLEGEDTFPYADCYFDVVTMLAVIEHIELHESFRVLKPGGSFVATVPAGWTDPLLRVLAKAGMVSSEEIEEHKDTYNYRKIRELLVASGFAGENIRCGYFEMFMNLWFAAVKTSTER